MPISAILFDADGVIQRSIAFDERIRRAFGEAPMDIEGCISDIFAAEKPCLAGEADYAEALGPVLEKWGAPCDAAAFFKAWHVINTAPGMIELIGGLRRSGVYCALASNQEAHRARHMSTVLGYGALFDDEFYSCHLGHAKPSARYFEALLDRAGLDPRTTLFIDDLEENVAAARGVGLQAVQFELVGEGDGLRLAGLLEGYGVRAA
jgi:HAD superfamily hydrolase (TIGR01509 family)